MSKGKWLRMVLVGGLAWAGGAGAASGSKFQAVLNGARVAPEAVQTRANGQARFVFVANGSRLDYRLRLRDGAGIEAARLHCAPAGATGPVITELLGPVPGGWSGNLDLRASLGRGNLDDGADCAAAIGRSIATLADLADAMADQQVYVDVVSEQYPEGEIRGQVRPLVPPAPPSDAGPSPMSRATTPRPKIFVGSPPLQPSILAGTAAVPLRFGAPFPPAGFSGGVASISISAGTFRIPIAALGVPSTAFTTSSLLVSIPDIALSVPESNFTLPQFSLGLPASSFTFEPSLNPPYPTATFAIPATVVSFPAVIQGYATLTPIPALATLSFPAMTFSPTAPFPGRLAGTLVISLGAAF